MKKIVSLLSFAVFVSVLSPATSHAAALYHAGSVGVDVSYPNCSTVLPKADFGIVGVTGGLVYSTNPCLAAQATKFSDLSLYVNTGLNASQTSQHYLKAQE